jgi:hypothetical protein
VPLDIGLLDKWEFQIISVLKLKLQSMIAESLSLARAQRMNQNNVGKFFYLLEKLSTENNLCDTSGNIFNIDKSGMPVNNKPGPVITEKRSKYVNV